MAEAAAAAVASSPAKSPANAPQAKSPASARKSSPLIQAVGSPRVAAPASSPAASVKKSPSLRAKSPASAVKSSPLIQAATSPAASVKKSPALQAAKSPAATPRKSVPSSPAAAASPKPAASPRRASAPASPAAAVAAAEAATEAADAAAAAPAGEGKTMKEVLKEKARKLKEKKLAKAEAKAAKEDAGPVLPATSSREDNLNYDLKHMAAYDIAPQPANTKEADFLVYTRDSVQLLVNKLFLLPKSKIEEGQVVELPKEETFRVPRMKPIPKAVPQTRFGKFMEERNMTKRKRSRLVFDEISGDWKPRWGYGSVKKAQEKGKMGVHEVKTGENPDANPFERMAAEKKLHVMRQKMREVRNKVEAAGGKVRASVPDLTRDGLKRGKDGLKEVLKRSQVSSGSRFKFDRVAPNEATNLQQKRQKISEPMTGNKERERYMKFAGKVLSGETVDKDKAAKVGRQQAQGTKVPPKKKGRGNKGTPGEGRRSKQGGRANAKKGGKGGGKGGAKKKGKR